MPTISPQIRAAIGEQVTASPRGSVKASTGMNLPKNPDELPTTAPKTGQVATTEETAPQQAVTLSPQLTALARKQQKLQQEIQAQKDREAEWAKKEADYLPKSTFKAKLQQNAVEALKDLGVDYEELSNLLIEQSNGQDPVKELRSEIDQMKKSQEESVNKQYENTLKQYKAEADALVMADPKVFHFINKGKHQDAVVQHIVDTWKEDDSKVLTVAEAAKEVEEFLRDDAKEKAAALKELEPEIEETPAQKKTLPPPKAASKTLTQQVEVTPQRTYNQFQHLSPKERIAQAIARAQR